MAVVATSCLIFTNCSNWLVPQVTWCDNSVFDCTYRIRSALSVLIDQQSRVTEWPATRRRTGVRPESHNQFIMTLCHLFQIWTIQKHWVSETMRITRPLRSFFTQNFVELIGTVPIQQNKLQHFVYLYRSKYKAIRGFYNLFSIVKALCPLLY